MSGGEWENSNVTKAKSKTFVRGIPAIPQKLRRTKKISADPEKAGEEKPTRPKDTPQSPPEMEFDSDVEERDGVEPPHHFWQHEDQTKAHWKKTLWEDVRVGDFVKVLDHENIPADILICATSEEENVAFVETKNLDGETNLKSRNAVPALTNLRTARECASKRNAFQVDCDRPDNNMFRLNAAVRVGKDISPVDMQMMLLRGTVLRNTEWVIGVVLFTGEDTKIVLNSGGTPSKRSKVERQMNPQV